MSALKDLCLKIHCNKLFISKEIELQSGIPRVIMPLYKLYWPADNLVIFFVDFFMQVTLTGFECIGYAFTLFPLQYTFSPAALSSQMYAVIHSNG